MTRWRLKSGAPKASAVPASRPGPAGSTPGSGSSSISGPVQGTEKAASTSATRRSSWVMRADSVLTERPARSTRVTISTAPGSGARA
jgi:hypothetical protein